MNNQEPDIQHISPEDIVVEHDKRHRLTTQSGVDSVIASIDEVGGIKMPISLRLKRRPSGDMLVLMDGMHRLEAALTKELPTVPVRIWKDVTDADAEMIELDMNLAGASLTPLDEAVFLAARKKFYEQKHPETKAGIAGALGKWDANDNLPIASFVTATAKATGVHERKIQRRVAAGMMLSKDQVTKLRQAPQTLKAGDVEALGKIKDYHVRSSVIDRLQHGHAKSVPEAISEISPKAAMPNENKADAEYRKFATTWKRLPKVLRERFVNEFGANLRAMLDAGE